MDTNKNCCSDQALPKDVDQETIRIEKTKAVRSVCEEDAEKQKEKPGA